MPFTAPSTPRCPPPDVCRPVEYAGPDMPFTASSALQCPEYIPPSMTQSTADSHSQFHPSQLGPSPSRNRTDKVTLLSSADTPKSIPGSQPAPRGEHRYKGGGDRIDATILLPITNLYVVEFYYQRFPDHVDS